MTTKDAVLRLVRREALTANELADRLGVTRNAVVVPLKQLESEQLIVPGERRKSGVGKPPIEYVSAPGTEDAASTAYRPFLKTLLDLLTRRLGTEQTDHLLKDVGRAMAAEVNVPEPASFADRLNAARTFLDGVGADVEEETDGTDTVIRSYTCPLGRIVRDEPCACTAIESFLSDVTQADVQECCKRDERLICQFRISSPQS